MPSNKRTRIDTDTRVRPSILARTQLFKERRTKQQQAYADHMARVQAATEALGMFVEVLDAYEDAMLLWAEADDSARMDMYDQAAYRALQRRVDIAKRDLKRIQIEDWRVVEL